MNASSESNILVHRVVHDSDGAGERVAAIVTALDILAEHPRIGRPAGHSLRELVIGHDSRGHVALYAWRAEQKVVRVVGIRAQREAGYPGLG